MKKSYSKPRLKTEAFTPQEAITACWTSYLTCNQLQLPNSSVWDSGYNRQGSISSHTCEPIKITIYTDGETQPPSERPDISQFKNPQVFIAYLQNHASGQFKPNSPHQDGYAWYSSSEYHFTTSRPTKWDKNHS